MAGGFFRFAPSVEVWMCKFAVVLIAVRSCIVRGMNRFVNVDVPGSARKLTLLEGSMKANDDEGAIGEPMTFVPECKWYRKLPCTCDHVIFHRQDGSFIPGWERFWHLPSLMLMLTVQTHYRKIGWKEEPASLGRLFWHSTGLANFKNSMDVANFVAEIYSGHFKYICEATPECVLTIVFTAILDWLVTLIQWQLSGGGAAQDYRQVVVNITRDVHVESWASAPWELLLSRPMWAETFLYASSELRVITDAAGAELPEVAPSPDVDAGAAQKRCPIDNHNSFSSVDAAVAFAFDKTCDLHPARRIARLGRALGQLLSRPTATPWPDVHEGAHPLSDQYMYRFCHSNVVHRRVGNVELHFLATDAVRVGGEIFVELLWYVTSDDSCLMVGTNFHNEGNSYYSWAHMLPRAHVNHWTCRVRPLGRAAMESADVREGAATVSFSGFLSVSVCRLPSSIADSMFGDTATGEDEPLELEVSLLGIPGERGGSTWIPEPIRLCPVPRPSSRRFLSACTGTLHNADYINAVMPHAIEDWINYHLLVGVEHITVFDTDGSYAPYLQSFVAKGVVNYRPHFPDVVSPKLGLLTAGVRPEDRRPVLFEPHALDVCLWAYRHESEWVAVMHSFEEYFHSPSAVERSGSFSLAEEVSVWAQQAPRTVLFEVFQEPMGGPPLHQRSPRSTLSAWTHKRGLSFPAANLSEHEFATEAATHFQPFAWIADPLNVLQTAVHYAHARAAGQAVVVLPPDVLHVNHYLDLGSNRTRCLVELGSCGVVDESILWAEELVVSRRE